MSLNNWQCAAGSSDPMASVQIDMQFKSNQYSYANRLGDLQKAVDWLDSIGIKLASTRIASYERDMKSLMDAINANNLEAFTHDKTFAKIANSFYESSQLIDVHRGLSRIPLTSGLRSRLTKFAHGPVTSSEEKPDGKSHQPRDFGFELFTASLFVQAGFTLDLDQDTDVVAAQNGQSILVECKRPRHVSSLSPAIKSAASQLRTRLDKTQGNSNQFGLIALSVDLVLHKKQDFLALPNQQTAEAVLKGLVRDLISSHKSSWFTITHPQILGILFLLQLSAVLLDSHKLTRCGYLVGYNVVDISTSEGITFTNIVAQIGSSMFNTQYAR